MSGARGVGVATRARKGASLLSYVFLVIAVVLGATLAVAQEGSSGSAGGTAGSGSVSGSAAPSASATVVATGSTQTQTYTTGYSPVPEGSQVPKDWLPPGADDPDPGPSTAIFPSQRLTLRFNHKKHVQGQNLKCTYCHTPALKSTEASDDLVPVKHEKCIGCHKIDESQPYKEATNGAAARCDFCHIEVVVDSAAGTVSVAKLQIPTANLKMNHKAHLDQGITCEQCHGKVGELELSTRDQMPRMRGCFGCHQSADPGSIGSALKPAKSACITCHITDKTGFVLQTMWASGVMSPPRWLKNAKHGPDWIERHKQVAGNDSAFCSNCHKEEECTDCHDGKIKPQTVHPNDWLNMHEVAARFDQPKCSSCHSTTNFCLPCHTRVGVADSSPLGVATAGRFHPPPEIWSGQIRKAGHHSFEAQKNINACVSCHVERDCVVCHGTAGVGGASQSPHDLKFIDKCRTMYVKNPRPCFVCHDPYDKLLDSCR